METDTTAAVVSADADTNLYVCKLPPHYTKANLDDMFMTFGPILSSRILTDAGGRSKCSGLVKFSTKEHAELAISQLNNSTILPGSVEMLEVRYANNKNPTSLVPPTTYIGFVPQKDAGGPIRNKPNPINRFNPMGTPAESALSPMHQYGQPTYDQNTMQPGTYTPGTYTNHGMQQPGMQPPNPGMPQPGMPQPGMPPMPQPGMPMQPPPPSIPGYANGNQQPPIPPPTPEMLQQCFHHSQGWSLYVSNLADESDELNIYKLFAPFGAISSINPMLDKETGKSKGYGFINMPQYDSAYEAVRLMHGLEVAPGKTLSVTFKVNKKNRAQLSMVSS